MTKLICFVGICLLLTISLTNAQRGGRGGGVRGGGSACALAWEDFGFGGSSVNLCEGRSNVAADWNDRISSLDVPRGWTLRVWADYNFQGAARNFVGPFSGDVDQSWNDVISSYSLSRTQGGTGATTCALAWEDFGFGGSSVNLCEGRSNVAADWNDRISSIDVPSGWTLRVWADYNFQGAARNFVGPFSGDVDQSWNDVISSYSLSRTQGGTGGAGAITCALAWENFGFEGANVNLCQGSSNVAADWNDRISSLDVPSGWTLRVWADYNFQGAARNFVGPFSGDVDQSWNDVISSYLLSRIQDGTGGTGATTCALAWENFGFEGANVNLCQGSSNVAADWNDRISSINVPRGWTLRVWADYNFQGATRDFVGPFSGNVDQSWNDLISSYTLSRS